jgi:hypothetical protein
VLKTEQSANEKITLIHETSNQLFAQNIINIFAVANILTSRAIDTLFHVPKFTSVIKHVAVCNLGRYGLILSQQQGLRKVSVV